MKTKAIITIMLTVFLLSTLAVVAPVSAFTVATPPLMECLRGQRINLWNGDTSFFTSDLIHVWHGFYTGPPPDWPLWSEMSSAQKAEYMRTANFKLLIDDEEVRLHRYQWYDHQEDAMYIIFWISFKPYSFQPKVYTFRGEWYFEFNGIVYDEIYSEITVTVNPPP